MPETFSRRRKGELREKAYPISEPRRQGSNPLRENRYNLTVSQKRPPLFVIDENLPFYLESELRRRGYRAVHVRRIFRRGTPDRTIKEYAEKHNAVVLTRDTISFPEPKKAGDRVVIEDLPREKTVAEVLRRIKDLGW